MSKTLLISLMAGGIFSFSNLHAIGGNTPVFAKQSEIVSFRHFSNLAEQVNVSFTVENPEGGSANYSDEDYNFTDFPFTGELKKDAVIGIYASPNDGFSFDHFEVNGETFNTNGNSFITDFAVKDHLKNGNLEIKVFFKKDAPEPTPEPTPNPNPNPNPSDGVMDFHPQWGVSINPGHTDAKMVTSTVADAQGNVYTLFNLGGGADTATCKLSDEITLQAMPRHMNTVLVKYNGTGMPLWARSIRCNRVKGYKITLKNNLLYLVGTYGTSPKDLTLKADKGYGTEGPDSVQLKQDADDNMYVAIYDTEGHLQALKAIISSAPQIEIPTDILVSNQHLYISGSSEGNGKHPSYDGIVVNNTQVDGWNNSFGFVFDINVLDADSRSYLNKTLIINKIYAINGDDAVSLSALAENKGNIYATGYTSAYKIAYDGLSPIDVTASNNSLIFAELEKESSKFKKVRSLFTKESSVMGYALAMDKTGNAYIGGNTFADNNRPFSLADGTSPELKGAFMIKWNINSEKPEKAIAVGSTKSSDDNQINSLAIAKNEAVFFAGNYSGNIDAVDPPTNDLGEGDSFIGCYNPQKDSIEKFSAYGASGEESAEGISMDETGQYLSLCGYYSGSGFNLLNIKNTEGHQARSFYFANYNVANLTNLPRAIAADKKAVAEAHSFGLKWLIDGNYTLYSLNGSVVVKGHASVGETLRLTKGLYIVKVGRQIEKVIIK